MSKNAADADRRAAEYWRGVARVDRVDARAAGETARTLTTDARQEDRKTRETQARRRTTGVRSG